MGALQISQTEEGCDANTAQHPRSVFGAPFSFGKSLKFDRSRPGYLTQGMDGLSAVDSGGRDDQRHCERLGNA